MKTMMSDAPTGPSPFRSYAMHKAKRKMFR